ncbi:MAG: VanZ family protein [Candidatus Competibacteraceae bacterium]
MKSWLSRLIVLGLLMVGTIVFFHRFDRYEISSPELLTNPQFAEGLNHWELSGRGTAVMHKNTVLLRVDKAGAGVAVRQYLPDPKQYRMLLLQLTAKIKSEDIRPGTRFFQKGSLALISLDENQRMLRVPHLVAQLSGTHPWDTYQAVFRVPPETHAIRVNIQLIGATGLLAVKQLSLHAVRERAEFVYYQYLGIAIWLIALIWLGLPWLSQLRWDGPHAAIYLIVLCIAMGTLLPANLKIFLELITVNVLGRFIPGLEHTAEPMAELDSTPVSGFGHVLFFVLLAMAVRWAYPWQRRWILLLILLLFAAVTEILQFFAVGRTPSVNDFAIDGLGTLLGLGLFETATNFGITDRRAQ